MKKTTSLLIILITLFLLPIHLIAGETQPSPVYDTGLVYNGSDTNFWIQAPNSWILDITSGKAEGIPVVFYPKGGSWKFSSAIMYAASVIKEESYTTLDKFIENEKNTFKQKNKHYLITKEREYKTKDNKTAKIIEIEADAPGNYESIAYIEEKPGISILVLSAKTKQSYDEAISSFDELIASYKFAGAHITKSSPVSVSDGAVIPKEFPKDLIYNNAPISPTCFGMGQDSEFIALDKCSLKLDPDIKIVGVAEDLIKKGYIGFDYKTVDDSGSSSQSNGYNYYKVIGNFNNNYTIYALNNGGGSGQFSSIYSVSRKQDNLKIAVLVSGGDRCNGGIYDVKQKDRILTYSENITPADFLEMTKNNPHNLRAYDDLDACAICCAATAIYEANLNKPNMNAKLISVKLGVDSYSPYRSTSRESLDSSENKPYQACFNKLIKRYKDNGKASLTEDELKKFMTIFNAECDKAHN